jgi:hypothetical protein
MGMNGYARRLELLLTEELLRSEYERLGGIYAVAKSLGISYNTISKRFKRFSIEIDRRNFICQDENIFAKDTETSFYLAGFIAADGCICERTITKQSALAIQLSEKDADFLQTLKDAFQFNGPIHSSLIENSNRNPNWCDSVNRGFVITSDIICRDLERFNIVPRKTLIYRFPEWLINHPLVHHYMRGYNDGDGCIRLKKWYASGKLDFQLAGQPAFLEVYKQALETRCGINNPNKTIQLKRKASGNVLGVLQYCGNNIVQKIAQFLYKDATIYLPRKYDVVRNQADFIAQRDHAS